MRRFLVRPEQLAAQSAEIDGDLYRHISKVLRLKIGDRIKLFDGTGRESAATISRLGNRNLTVTLETTAIPVPTRSAPVITLIQGLPKGEKLDLIIQKATELGAHSIIAFPAARSVVRIPPAQIEQRISRWQRIAGEAARQSQRSSVPRLSFAPDLAAALAQADLPTKLLLWEGERECRLKETLALSPPPTGVVILVGPEGGLTDEEAASAVVGGFVSVSLGPRILRTETAGLAMLAILQYQWGDMG